MSQCSLLFLLHKITIFRSHAFDVIHLKFMGGGCVSGFCSCGFSIYAWIKQSEKLPNQRTDFI